MTGREILTEAADLVEAGWTQNSQVRQRGSMRLLRLDEAVPGDCFCAVGALRYAYGSDALHLPQELVKAVVAQIPYCYRREMGREVDVILNFNDAPSRKQAEVVAVFRRAAEAFG